MLENFQSLLKNTMNEAKNRGSIKGTGITYIIKKSKGGPIKTQFGSEDQYIQQWYWNKQLFATVTGSDIGLKTQVVDQETLGEALNDLLTI